MLLFGDCKNLREKAGRRSRSRGRGGCRRRSLLFFFSLRRHRRCRIRSRSLARAHRWGGWCCFKKKAGVVVLVEGKKEKKKTSLFFFSAKAARGVFQPSCSRIPFPFFRQRSSASLAHRFSFISIGMGRLEAALSPGIELGDNLRGRGREQGARVWKEAC